MKSIFFAVLVVGIIGCSKSPSPDSSKKATSLPDGWLSYEDDMFKAAYPPKSTVEGAPSGKQDPKNVFLSIIPPNDGQGGVGGFHLAPDPVTKNMLLRDAVQTDIARFKGNGGVLVSAPQYIPVGNGRCISAVVVTPAEYCKQNAGSCFSPLIVTQCDGPNGNRFNAHTGLSVGSSRNALSAKAQQEAAVYERILRSLEFKKS